MNEMHLAAAALGLRVQAAKQLNELKKKTGHDEQLLLELAVDYGNCGMFHEAIDILLQTKSFAAPNSDANPMVYYYPGYFHTANSDTNSAKKYFTLAAQIRPDYCFPFRTESIRVLRLARKHTPTTVVPRTIWAISSMTVSRRMQSPNGKSQERSTTSSISSTAISASLTDK